MTFTCYGSHASENEWTLRDADLSQRASDRVQLASDCVQSPSD